MLALHSIYLYLSSKHIVNILNYDTLIILGNTVLGKSELLSPVYSCKPGCSTEGRRHGRKWGFHLLFPDLSFSIFKNIITYIKDGI